MLIMCTNDSPFSSPVEQNNNSQESRANILLVDDDPSIIIALEFLMKQQGYQVQIAENGQQALDMVENFIPNVILLDVMMPGMDGFEVAKKIRANDALCNTQIIFLTAKGTKEDRRKGYKSGGEVYLIKPFDNDELIETVAYALKI